MSQLCMRKWVSSTAAAAVAGLFLASLAVAQPAKPAETQAPAEKGPVKTEPLCRPAGPLGKGACQATIECPTIKSPGKTVCQVTIDCPPPKAKTKTKEKK